ncbi:MFS transporter [Micromonospora wenchangensis]|uniref:MFS transporter n=1 Tax=Micromonospora wenchangensis TaxID=1185415 RepID=UPI0037FEE14D
MSSHLSAPDSAGAQEHRDRPTRRARIHAVAVLLATTVLPLTITGASVALPGIQHDLQTSTVAAQWVVNAYNATFAAFLVLGGAVTDRWSPYRVFLSGVAVFAAASAASAFAPTVLVLNLTRAVTGVGAAATVTGGVALLSVVLTGRAQARAFGLLGTLLGVGLAFGPQLSGVALETLGWQAVFGVPAVVGVLVIGLVLAARPPAAGRRASAHPPFDWAGASLFTGASLIGIATLVEAPRLGATHPLLWGGAILSAVLLLVFVGVERRVAHPVTDLTLLRNPRYTAIAITAGTLMVVLVPILVYLPSYLINVVGLSPTEAGAWMLVLTAPTIALPPVGGLLIRSIGMTPVLVTAVVLCGLGALGLVTLSPGSTLPAMALPLLAIGAGAGLPSGHIDRLAVSEADESRRGAAAGLFNTIRLSTENVSIAAAGAFIAAASPVGLRGRHFTDALHTVALALAVVAIAVAVLLVAVDRRARGAGRVEHAGPAPVRPAVSE